MMRYFNQSEPMSWYLIIDIRAIDNRHTIN